MILTRYLSVEEVGRYYIYLTISIFLSFIFLAPISQYYIKKLPLFIEKKSFKESYNKFFLLKLSLLVVALIISMIIWFLDFFSFKDNFYIYLLTVFSMLASAYSIGHLSIINQNYGVPIFVRFSFVNIIFGYTFSCFLFYVLRTPESWLIGLGFGNLVSTLISLNYIRIKEKSLKKESVEIDFKDIYVFCIPLMVSLFIQWGQNSGYRLIVDTEFGLESVALLSLGFYIAAAVFSSCELIVSQLMMPKFYQRLLNNKHDEAWFRLFRVCIASYILLIILVFIMSDTAVDIIGGESYKGAGVYVCIGAVCEFFRVMINVISKYSVADGKTVRLVVPAVVGLMLTYFGIIWASDNVYQASLFIMLGYSVSFLIMMRAVFYLIGSKINIDYAYVKKLLPLLLLLSMVIITDSFFYEILLVVFSSIYFVVLFYKEIERYRVDGE